MTMSTRAFLLAGMLLTSFVASGVQAAESVSLGLIKPYAYESDPTNGYGEFFIRRSVALNTPLVVNIRINIAYPLPDQPRRDTFIPVGNSTNGADFRIDYLPATAAPANFANEQITIPAGQSEVRARVYSYQDADQRLGELGEWVQMQLLSDNNSGKTYTITDSQTKTVQIIDANITAQMMTLENAAEKLNTPINGASFTTGTIANLRCWFQNGNVRGASPLRSFSPYARTGSATDGTFLGRYSEFAIGGTATLNSDYAISYHIGGNTRGSWRDGEPVSQPWAYRLRAENGIDRLAGVAGFTSFSVFSVSPAFTLPASFHNLRVSTAAFNGNATFQGYTNHALNDEPFWQVDFTGDGDILDNPTTNTPVNPAPIITGNEITEVVSGATRNTITVANAVNRDIGQGENLVIRYETLTLVTTPSTGVPPGPTTRAWVPTTVSINVIIDENVIYPVGASSVSVSSPIRRPLRVGDVFEFSHASGTRYRITGPTPAPLPNLPVNGAGDLSIGASNLDRTFISFWPPLLNAITRDGGGATINGIFTPTVGDDGRFTVHIPGLVRPEDVDAGRTVYNAGVTATRNLYPTHQYDNADTSPNDMPIGDWIDFGIAVGDDTAIEGAETVTLTVLTGNNNNNYAVLNPGVATATIADNESVASVSAAAAVYEGGDPGRFTVNFSRAFPRDITVPYALQFDGLTNPTNWNTNYPTPSHPVDVNVDGLNPATGSGSVVLRAGQTSVDVQIAAIPDLLIEEIQQIKLQLQDSADYILASSTDADQNASAASLTVIDSFGSVTLSNTTPTIVYEGDVPSPQWTIQLIRRAGYENQPVTASLNLTGTALLNLDYTISLPAGATISGSDLRVPFPVGTTSQVITLTPRIDTLIEPSETVVLSLSQVPGDNYTPGNTLSSTFNIIDSYGVVTLSGPTTAEVYEGVLAPGPYPQWTFQISRRAGYENLLVTVSLSLTGTALLDQDYILTLPTGAKIIGTTISLPFPVGTSSQVITLIPRVDTPVEPDETATLSLEQVPGDNFTFGTTLSGTATIKDGKPPVTTGTATSGTATSGTPGATVTNGQVDQNQGCGAGGGVALLSGLLLLVGFRRRLR